jgi:hypothetical protein
MCDTICWYEDVYRSIVDTNLPVWERVSRISHILVIVDPSAVGRQAAFETRMPTWSSRTLIIIRSPSEPFLGTLIGI